MNKIYKHIKAYAILILSGWRTVEVMGVPKKYGRYMACLANRCVMEFQFSDISGSRWFKVGVGGEDKFNPVVFWKPIPKPPYF